jgi:hypothetical protein
MRLVTCRFQGLTVAELVEAGAFSIEKPDDVVGDGLDDGLLHDR